METVTLQLINVMIFILICFIISCLLKGNLQIMQKLYIMSSFCLLVWLAAVSGIMKFEHSGGNVLQVLDAITCSASNFLIMNVFVMVYCFVHNKLAMPKGCRWLYLIPSFTTLVVFTNPLHHLFYRQFSVRVQEIEFGPLFFFSGAQSYIWSIAIIVLMLRYGLKNKHRMVWGQIILFILGVGFPLIVNVLATLGITNLSIAATPMAFFVTIICHGIAIYFLNFLNIRTVAVQNIMDSITDCYVILSADTCIINVNQPFEDVFGKEYGMQMNVYLNRLVENLENRKKDVIYNLLNFFDVCKQSTSVISYEQAILREDGKRYYSVELTPIFIRKNMVGVIAMFKDVTKLKEDIRKERERLGREMERERLASLGQMIGSISHNLKTPIMSISGSVESVENLVREYRESVGDPEVTESDHQEIADEMEEWLLKVKSSCSYMSDVITTVKGLAANLNASEVAQFGIEEVFKKVLILMKQNLLKHRCALVIENDTPPSVLLNGDVNNLVQVLTNLVDNAKDAMAEKGGDIVLGSWVKEHDIYISVTDSGTGIPENIKEKLFVSMYTSKGAKGTGIGLYSSAGVIRGKFGGEIWAEDNPEGGAVFFIRLPLNA